MEEERRLAYVAVTRAKRRLTITWTQMRRLYGQAQVGTLSRFVREIPASAAAGLVSPAAAISARALDPVSGEEPALDLAPAPEPEPAPDPEEEGIPFGDHELALQDDELAEWAADESVAEAMFGATARAHAEDELGAEAGLDAPSGPPDEDRAESDDETP
ncbi:MAG: hypothetical protein KC731_04330, partial [Myxococcales bacterium]|nr:hypothetical protein [Myxococcales bacterium]